MSAQKASVKTPSVQQTIQQQRAQFALQIVQKISSDTDAASRFRAYSNSLPAMIQTNGLGQALAFAKSKANGKGAEAEAWNQLYTALNNWLIAPDRHIWPDGNDLMSVLIAGSQSQYQRAQAEAQQLLVWLKRFSRAYIKGGHDDAR